MYFQNEARFRAGLRILVGLFLISPFLIWLGRIEVWTFPDGSVLRKILGATLFQASLSTLASLVIGFILFQGLRAISSHSLRLLAEGLLLFPNLIPPLFIGISWLRLSEIFHWPLGFWSVVGVHALINGGLAALAFERIYQSQITGAADAAWTLGVRPISFWWRVVWPMAKVHVGYLSLFLFALHLTSFSLPLLVGGDRVVTLEVAIYQAIRQNGAWDQAVFLALVQTAILFLMALILPKPSEALKEPESSSAYPAAKFYAPLIALPVGFLGLGFFYGILSSTHIVWDSALNAVLAAASLTTLILGLMVGLAHVLFFLVIVYLSPHPRLERFLLGYLSPSPAITGFGLLLLPLRGDTARLFQCVIALTLISAPLLYRWLVHGALKNLERQMQVARTLGASAFRVMIDVAWPQVAGVILRASGLAALWAAGDFAISGIIFGGESTLALVVQNELNNYRFDTAQILLGPLLILGLSLYGFFAGVRRYVAG